MDYKVVIDAGHGGSDKGEKSGDITEADVSLEYAKLLKASLEVLDEEHDKIIYELCGRIPSLENDENLQLKGKKKWKEKINKI